MVQVGADRLYAATDKGIRILNLDTWAFEPLPRALMGLRAVRSLAVFDGKLWIGMRDEGLLAYNLSTGKLSQVPVRPGKKGLMCVLQPAEDWLYIGSLGGLFRYSRRTHKLTHVLHGGSDVTNVYSMHYDAAARCVWIGADERLLRCDARTAAVTECPGMANLVVKSVTRDTRSGDLLLGTESGLVAYNPASGKCLRMEHDTHDAMSLGNNVVFQVIVGSHGNVFVATGNGLSITNSAPYYKETRLADFVESKEGNTFTYILADRDGSYWLGGETGLLHCMQGGETVWYSTRNSRFPLRQDHIRDIYTDRDGDLWISTDAGVAMLNRSTMQFAYFSIGNRDNNTNWIYGVRQDFRGNMWIGTCMSGLFVLPKQRLLSAPNGCPLGKADVFRKDIIQSVWQITADKWGRIWANTNSGLVCIDPQRRRCDVKNIWLDLMKCDGGSIWYDDQGALFRYDIASGKTVPAGFRASEGTVNAIAFAGTDVWVSSIDGVACIDKATFRVTPTAIPDRQFHAAFYNPALRSIVFGGYDRLTTVSVAKFARHNRRLPLHISFIACDTTIVPCGKIASGGTIRLGAYRNVSIELASYSYMPEGEIFYYRLNGEKEWKRMSADENRLEFPVMPGGKNTLQVCTTNPETDRDALIATYYIIVPHPWYLSPWAWCVYVLVVLAVSVGAVRRQKKRNERRFQREAREKTMELARMKMDFFVNVSHELKTPLSLIIAPLGKLLSENTNARMRETLKGIQRNAMRLNSLVYKIVDFKQTEYDEENSLFSSHADMVALVQGCVSSFAEAAGQKGIAVNFSHSADELWAMVDVVKMESVLINLISNAVKHAPQPGGCVDVTLADGGESVEIVVADNGQGISQEELPMVFMRYYQGKHESRANHGTGIGLYLVKKYVEMHGGQVTADNRGGAVFTVVLPKNETAENSESVAAGAAEGSADSRDVVLVIDDNREIVDFLVSSLDDTYRCLKAHNGKEGMALVQNNVVNLVIVDQMMPVMDGFDFVREMKRSTATADIPIIMLTAKDDSDSEMQSIRLGVDLFVPKPFDFRKLQLQVMRLIKRTKSVQTAVGIRQMVEHGTAVPETEADTHAASADELFMKRLLDTIDANMEKEGFNISQLADALGIDQKQLYRKVKQFTGNTPVAFLRQMRLKKAAELLKQERFSVSEVMYMVGMTNSSYFSKCFIAEYGVSPKAFVRAHSNKTDNG